MQDAVDRGGPRTLTAVRHRPGRGEAREVVAPALGAGAVAGGERGRLVEEEQLGVAAWGQDRVTAPAMELQPAGHPMWVPPAGGPQPAGRVVEGATVAHERAAGIG